ncbi:MAG: hypothetical protein VW547_16865, partial [Alphaproteobacteria bacterium]
AEEAGAITGDLDRALRRFIRMRLLDTGWIRQIALRIKSYKRFFAARKVRRVLVGDVTGGDCRVIAETAHAMGIPVDELLNGMFVVPQKYDARCGDTGCAPIVARMLSWGRMNEEWLAMTGAGIEVRRTGYPALDGLRRRVPKSRAGKPRRALVLPIYADADDVMALTSNIFSYLVDTIRVLDRAGIGEIRVKLHSGPQNLDYYRDVAVYSGVACEVIKGGDLVPHLDWADIVVGPVNSGAFVETMAAGVPYYAYRPWPSLISRALLDTMGLLDAPEDLARALGAGREPDRRAILDRVCSFGEIENAAARVWETIEADRK